ncbi:hypothetical protein BV22DRAFT_1051047 [Leucogyrophana mollusca]|uniref:Uncharacterized protein n=1 Tax=Leucogyrophana mollusca TaxID=85980 RepID=A0ACB8B3Y6_9AGAM|nr:hypothetical protein BV22DRAFT_1051047 [Leucogyrophana mollusca]
MRIPPAAHHPMARTAHVLARLSGCRSHRDREAPSTSLIFNINCCMGRYRHQRERQRHDTAVAPRGGESWELTGMGDLAIGNDICGEVWDAAPGPDFHSHNHHQRWPPEHTGVHTHFLDVRTNRWSQPCSGLLPRVLIGMPDPYQWCHCNHCSLHLNGRILQYYKTWWCHQESDRELAEETERRGCLHRHPDHPYDPPPGGIAPMVIDVYHNDPPFEPDEWQHGMNIPENSSDDEDVDGHHTIERYGFRQGLLCLNVNDDRFSDSKDEEHLDFLPPHFYKEDMPDEDDKILSDPEDGIEDFVDDPAYIPGGNEYLEEDEQAAAGDEDEEQYNSPPAFGKHPAI